MNTGSSPEKNRDVRSHNPPRQVRTLADIPSASGGTVVVAPNGEPRGFLNSSNEAEIPYYWALDQPHPARPLVVADGGQKVVGRQGAGREPGPGLKVPTARPTTVLLLGAEAHWAGLVRPRRAEGPPAGHLSSAVPAAVCQHRIPDSFGMIWFRLPECPDVKLRVRAEANWESADSI